jgi:hypothetical protein
VGDVDAEPVDAAVEPEPHDAVELGRHLGVVPVQVGLLGGEDVQIPLPVRNLLPGRAAEHRGPVVRRQLTLGAAAVPEDEPLPLRAAGPRGQRRLEPRVLLADVVGHQVDRHAQPGVAAGGQQRVEVGERAEDGVDIARVGDVITSVGHRRAVERRQPQRVDPELRQVRDALTHAEQVADAVAVAVGEALRIDLVEHGATPPRTCDERIWLGHDFDPSRVAREPTSPTLGADIALLASRHR